MRREYGRALADRECSLGAGDISMAQALSADASRRSAGAAFAALAVGALAMGASPIFVRWADVGPFTSAFWRVTLALPMLYLWMRFAERDARPARRVSRP